MSFSREADGKQARRRPDQAVFRALSMRPETDRSSLQLPERTLSNGGPRIIEVGPGVAVSAFAGPNPSQGTERAVFMGGALICLSFSGLRASRVGQREFELSGQEDCVALLSPRPVEVASIATAQRTRKTVAAFVSQSALDDLGVDLFGSWHQRNERLRQCRMTPVARSLATELLKPASSAQVLRFRSEALVLELLAAFQEQSATVALPKAPVANRPALSAIQRARDIIVAAPSSNHSLVSIAAAAGVSVATLKREFHRTFGTSPIAFLRQQRLELGRALIEREGLSVSSAAYACGYDHPGNFAQAFRKHYGFPPSALRR